MADRQETKIEEMIGGAAQRGTDFADVTDDYLPEKLSTAKGWIIDQYRTIRELGSGGMGTVLLAERADAQYAQQVAIKLIRGFPSEDGKQRLRLERQILAQLDHPNIARLIGGGETPQGQPYLVMEYVDGVTLDTYLLQENPSLQTRLLQFTALLSAVAHAHRRLVVHRDIKPKNVLVRADGVVKLLDFGIAKLLEFDGSSERQTSTRAFSVGFSSPEQREGSQITVASDVYSLGQLLMALMSGVATEKTQPDLFAIARKATELAANDRYSSIETLENDLLRFQQGRPVRAARNTLWYRSRKFIQRHRLAVVAFLIGAVATVGFVWQLDQQRRIAVEARLKADKAVEYSNLRGQFFAKVFSGITPSDVSKGLSAKALLDRTRERLLADKTLDPAARADVAELLSSAYVNSGDFVAARELATIVVEHSMPPTPGSATEFEATMINANRWRELARLMLATDQYQQAWQALDQSQALLDKVDPSAKLSSAMLQTRILLARVWTARALYRTDEKEWTQKALDYANLHLPPGNRLIALALGEHAVAVEISGDFEMLIKLRRQVVQMMEADKNTYQRDLAHNRVNLARAYMFNQNFEQSALELDKAERELISETGNIVSSGSLDITMQRAHLAFATRDPVRAESYWQAVEKSADSVGFIPRFSDRLLAAQIAHSLGNKPLLAKRSARALALARDDQQRANVASLTASMTKASTSANTR
jgi:eukaryotic-like serine/threonine-protein kinase